MTVSNRHRDDGRQRSIVRLCGEEATSREATQSAHIAGHQSSAAHLGISSFFGAGEVITELRLAYPLSVLASFSIAWKTAHPRSLHASSPVVRHMR